MLKQCNECDLNQRNIELTNAIKEIDGLFFKDLTIEEIREIVSDIRIKTIGDIYNG